MNIQELRVYSHVLVDGNEETIVGIDAVKNEVLLDGWVFSVPLGRLRGIPPHGNMAGSPSLL